MNVAVWLIVGAQDEASPADPELFRTVAAALRSLLMLAMARFSGKDPATLVLTDCVLSAMIRLLSWASEMFERTGMKVWGWGLRYSRSGISVRRLASGEDVISSMRI